jgi:hypothetical protein
VRVAIARPIGAALVLVALAVAAIPELAHAQSSVRGLGYGIGGPAGYSGFFGSNVDSFWHVAGGGEVLARGRAGAAGEFGLLLGASGAVMVTSVNGVVHLAPHHRDRPFSPFVSSGYTRMWDGEVAFDAWNVGGGLDIWTRSGPGVRLDIRDHLRPDSRGAVHYWSLRAGIAFR